MIADKLNNKQYLRLVTSTKTSPLDLNQRLAYSALLTKADGLSQGAVSSLTGLDAKGTVAAALKALARHGLAVQHVNHWFSLEPNEGREDWFSIAIKDEDWRSRLAYTKLYRRAKVCPLTLRQVVVYSTLISLAKGSLKRTDLPESSRGRVCDGLTHEYLSLITGVGVKTVKATINKLTELKLAKSFPSTLRSRFALVLLVPPNEVLSWFQHKEVETYPGLLEYMKDEPEPVQEDDEPLVHAEAKRLSGPEVLPPTSARISEQPTEESDPGHHRPPGLPECEVEQEIMLPTIEIGTDSIDPLERHRRHVLGVRLGKEQEIKQVLLSFGYSEPSATKLSGSFDRSGLPSFDIYKKMIYDAEATYRRNRSEGRYPKVRTSELLIVKWLDYHRQAAVEKFDRFLEAHDQRAWQRRLSDIGRAALERAWEEYSDSLKAPFDARLFAERVADGERLWLGWERDYGQDACRRALIGLTRVRIEEMLVEPGRIEPEEFILRLRTIAPPRTISRKPSEDEMYEAWQAEMRAA